MIFKKNSLTERIIEQVEKHTNAVRKCVDYLDDHMDIIIECQKINNHSELQRMAKEVSNLEHEADMCRHEVIVELLSGGLLVENRKTMMRLIESFDKVADFCEDIVKIFAYEHMKIYSEDENDIKDIIKYTDNQLEILIDVFLSVFSKYRLEEVLEKLRQIEEIESNIDAIEDRLIVQLFHKDIALAEKLHYKTFIVMISDISDHIEDISDELEIIVASRSV